jgi:hypothetical protein
MSGYVGLYVEPENPEDFIQLGDGRWYPKGMPAQEQALHMAISSELIGLSSEAAENPKYVQALKDGKAPMDKLVLSVLEGDAKVHALGADKYGERNWRKDPIKASTYEGAILRHFAAYFARGEDLDPESGLSHLYHIRACCAVMLDSEMSGTLIDDRNRGSE